MSTPWWVGFKQKRRDELYQVEKFDIGVALVKRGENSNHSRKYPLVLLNNFGASLILYSGLLVGEAFCSKKVRPPKSTPKRMYKTSDTHTMMQRVGLHRNESVNCSKGKMPRLALVKNAI